MKFIHYLLIFVVIAYLALQSEAVHAMTPIISAINRPTLLSFKIFWWLPRLKPDHYILKYKPLSKNNSAEFKEVGAISNDRFYLTLRRLQHNTEYEIRMVSVDKNGRQFLSDPAYAFTGNTGTDGIYIINGQREYFFSQNRQYTWHDGKFFCKNIDMELLSVETAEENKFIKKYLENQNNGRSYWTSGSDRGGNNNEFYWDSTGKDLSFMDFYPNEPNNGGGKGEYYIGYIYDRGNYRWNDLNGTQHLGIICEQSILHFYHN